MAIKHHLVSGHSELEMHHTVFTYAYLTVDFLNILISLSNIIGITNSVKVLYSTSPLIELQAFSESTNN
jgi:hypothetical protein